MEWIDNVLRDVAELPDRNSPEDWPEAMLVTGAELRQIIVAHAAEAPQSGPVLLTDEDFFQEIEGAGIPVEDVAMACAIKDLVQTAVLRANGLKPQAKGD